MVAVATNTTGNTSAVHDSWMPYIRAVQQSVDINFYGNISLLKEAEMAGDYYIPQLKRFGLNLAAGQESPVDYLKAINVILSSLTDLRDRKLVTDNDLLWPARMVKLADGQLQPTPLCQAAVIDDNSGNTSTSEQLLEDGVLSPIDFIRTLAAGFFPLGGDQVLHTNQSLAEHDLAHMTSFINNPTYMAAIRQMARRVLEQALNDFNKDKPPVEVGSVLAALNDFNKDKPPVEVGSVLAALNDFNKDKPPVEVGSVLAALNDFNSPFSLRIYYAVEAYVCIDPGQKDKLQELLTIRDGNKTIVRQLPLDWSSVKSEVVQEWLIESWRRVGDVQFMKSMSRVYEAYLSLTISLGGESLDLLNRARKFDKPNKRMTGKYERSNIHYWHQKGLRCLRNIRPCHADNAFLNSIIKVHTPFIGALVGTSLLSIEDWVAASSEFTVDTNSPLYNYICQSGFWTSDSLLYTSFAGNSQPATEIQ